VTGGVQGLPLSFENFEERRMVKRYVVVEEIV
jgi:hypothetical protein